MSNYRPPYSCSSSDLDRNRFLDGDPHDDLREYLDHLADCGPCRRLHRAAIRATELFADLPPITPSPDFADRIFAAVQADRARPKPSRKLLSRRNAFALAASLFICTFIGLSWFVGTRTVPIAEGVIRGPEREAPALVSVVPMKLKDRISSAGSAFLARTQQATTATIPNIPLSNALTGKAFADTTPTLSTIDRVGSGASSTIAPIATSTRRMIDLFRRELPGAGPNLKPNS